MHARLHWIAAMALAAVCQPALAWTPDLHRFIVEAALEISPAAAARIPPRYVEDLLTAAEGDRLSENLRAPFQEAQSTLDFLLSSQKEPWSRNRAMSVGRLLNLVSHASIARDQYGPARTETLFSLREVVVFRTRRDLTPKLKDSLSNYFANSLWSEDPTTEMAERFRDAANLVADALMRLPGPTEDQVPPGPVLFIYDPLNSGVASIPIFRGPLTTVNYSSPSAIARALLGPTPKPTGKAEEKKGAAKADAKSGTKADQKPDSKETRQAFNTAVRRRSRFWRVFELPGVSPIECKSRQTETDYIVRLLFFNNSDQCFTEFVAKGVKWDQKIPFVLPAFSFRQVEFNVPKKVLEEEIEFLTTGMTDTCPEPAAGTYQVKSYKPVPSNGARGPNFSDSPVMTQLPAL